MQTSSDTSTRPQGLGGLTNLTAPMVRRTEVGSARDLSVRPMSVGRPDRAALRVLLVEDDPGDARLVWEALRASTEARFTVVHGQTLAEGLKILGEQPVDVVLLDLTLPDSAGLSTFSRVQAAAPHLPIVVMTGISDPEFASYALEVGAQDYLVKSDDPGLLVGRAIRYAITRMNAQIERQMLIERLEQEQAAIHRELEAARAMQFDLLPRPDRLGDRLASLGLNVEAYFEPSSGIGGDLWGCLDSGDGRQGFFAFDFSGHGISAALNVFRLHTLIDDHSDLYGDPGALLGVLNNGLKGLLGPGQYATMVVCIVDIEAGELVWASAGAPQPLLASPRTGMRWLDTRGVPLGVMAEIEYPNRRCSFPPGSSLFLYSDAITESVDAHGEMIGEEGLLQLFSEPDQATGLPCLLDRFFTAVPGTVEDDLTAIWISRLAQGREGGQP
ncbi:MAG: PP2C family protein-serine/threonine phosphatase [Actinomycetota bacterium]